MKKQAAAPSKVAAVTTISLPVLNEGEHYAGIALNADGVPTHHLILLPGELESGTWNEAKGWAKKQGGELPTRQEQSLLFANAKQHFESSWYWSGEKYASGSDSAWNQNFLNGFQISGHEDSSDRARAVRRLPI